MGKTKTLYETSLFTKSLGWGVDSYEDLIESCKSHIQWLKEMQAAGVKMENEGGGHFQFTTGDKKVAKQFGLEEYHD